MGVTGLSFIRRSATQVGRLINKSPRHAGIRLNRMYEKTQRPGSGCTNIGATSRQTQTGLIRSMQISIGHSKTCSSPKRREVLQKATKETKIESRLDTYLDYRDYNIDRLRIVCR